MDTKKVESGHEQEWGKEKQEIIERCRKMLFDRYGENVPEAVAERLSEELRVIGERGYWPHYYLSMKVTDRLRKLGAFYRCRGAVGNSLVAELLGITHTEDAMDLPPEIFYGWEEEIEPDIDLSLEKRSGYAARKHMQKLAEEGGYPVMDIVPESFLTKLHLAVKTTGVPLEAADIAEVDLKTIDYQGILGRYFLDPELVAEILRERPIETMEDLLAFYGLEHGTDTWRNNEANRELFRRHCPEEPVITHREDIIEYLMSRGFAKKEAFEIEEDVRRGWFEKKLTEELRGRLFSAGVSETYIEAMKKTRYLFPRAHSLEWIGMFLKLRWYQQRYGVDVEF